jgi:hypothetical protein
MLRVVLCMALCLGCVTTSSTPKANPRNEPHPLDYVVVERVMHLKDSGVTLTVNSTQLTRSGQWFEVTWDGVPEPSFNDWIGLYVPASADVTSISPAKYKMASSVASHLSEGRGVMLCAPRWTTCTDNL